MSGQVPAQPNTPPFSGEVLTREKWSYAVIDGHLVIFDPDEGSWNLTEIKDVERVRLGADGRPYALTKDGLVIQIPPGETTGIISKSKRLIQLPSNGQEIQDFAVSPIGSIAYVLKSEHPGHFAFIDVLRLGEFQVPDIGMASVIGNRATDWVPIYNLGNHRIVGMTFDDHGRLHVRDEGNYFYEGSRRSGVLSNQTRSSAGARANGSNWHFDLVVDAPLQGPQAWLRRGGAETNDDGSLTNFFSQFEEPKPFRFGLAAFPGYAYPDDRARSRGISNLKTPFLRDYPGQSLRERHRRYLRNYLSTLRPFPRRYAGVQSDLRILRTADTRNSSLLDADIWIPSLFPSRTRRAGQTGTGVLQIPDWAGAIQEKTLEVVRDLENRWLQEGRKLRRAPGQAAGPQNIFDQLYSWRVKFFGPDAATVDAVTQTLRRLRDEGAYLVLGPNPGKAKVGYVELVRQLDSFHEALAWGRAYAEAGFPGDALQAWARSIADHRASPKLPPERRASTSFDPAWFRTREKILLLVNNESAPLLDRLEHELTKHSPVRVPDRAVRSPNNIIFQLYSQRVGALGRHVAGKDHLTNRLSGLLNKGVYGSSRLHYGYADLVGQLARYNAILTLAVKAGEAGIRADQLLPWVQSIVSPALPQTVGPMPAMPVWAERINEQLLPKVNESSLDAIKDLEQSLRTRKANDEENQNYQTEPRYQRATARPDLVWSPSNTLFRVWNARSTLLGDAAATDVVTERLRKLLIKNVYLPLGRDRHLVRGRAHGGKLPLHLVRRSTVPCSVLLSSTAMLVQSARAGQAGTLPNDLKDLVDSIDDSQSVLLRKANFQDTARYAEFSRILNRMNGALKNPSSQLTRAAQARDVRIDVADLYTRMVQQLKEGEQLSLGISSGAGLDLDGDSFVAAIADLIKHLPPGLNSFNIQPTSTISATRDSILTIARTSDGITVTFREGTETEFTPFSAKFTVGYGWELGRWRDTNETVHAGHGASAFFFLGIETIPSIGIRQLGEVVASFEIPYDDQAKVPEFLGKLFRGELSSWEMLRQSKGANVTQGAFRTFKAALPIQPFVTIGGVIYLPWFQLKAIFAPILMQTNFGLTYTRGKSITTGPNGVQERFARLLAMGLQLNIGSIRELQIANVGILPDANLPNFDPQTHKSVDPSGVHFQQQHKLPVAINFVQLNLWGKQVENEGYTLVFDQDLNLEAVNADVRTSKAPFHDWAHRMKLFTEGAEHFNENNLPPLAALEKTHPPLVPYIETLKKSKERVSTTMELTPAALKVVRDYLSGEQIDLSTDERLRTNPRLGRLTRGLARRPASSKGVNMLVKVLMSDPENLRITRISAAFAQQHTELISTGIFLFRRQTGAKTVYNRQYANIQVNYGPGNEGTFQVSGDLLLPKKDRDFRQIYRIAAEKGTEFLELLKSPVPLGSEWMAGLSMAGPSQDESFLKPVGWSSASPGRTGDVILYGGSLAYRTSTGRTIHLPKTTEDRLLNFYRGRLLGPMSQGANKILDDRGSVLTENDYQELSDLATKSRAEVPEAPYNSPTGPDPELELSVHGIMISLRNELRWRQNHPNQGPPFYTPLSNPGQRAILERLFPNPDGKRGIDLNFLGTVLQGPSAPAQLQLYLHSIGRFSDPIIAGDLQRERLAGLLGVTGSDAIRGAEKLVNPQVWQRNRRPVLVGFRNGTLILRTVDGRTKKDLPLEMVDRLVEKYPPLLYAMIQGANGSLNDPDLVLTERDYLDLWRLAADGNIPEARHPRVAPDPERPFSVEKFMDEIAAGNMQILENPGWRYVAFQFFRSKSGGVDLEQLEAVSKNAVRRHQFLSSIERHADLVAVALANDPQIRPLASLSGNAGAIRNALPDMSPLLPAYNRRFSQPAAHSPLRRIRLLPTDAPRFWRDGLSLDNGHPTYRMPDGRAIDLPQAILIDLVRAYGLPLLLAMSQGSTGYLRPLQSGSSSLDRGLLEDWGLTPEDTRQLVESAFDSGTSKTKHTLVPADDERPLGVNDILNGLRSGKITILDPAQEYILSRFFPGPDGRLSRTALKGVLDDPVRLRLFQRSIERYAAEAQRDIRQAQIARPVNAMSVPRMALEEQIQEFVRKQTGLSAREDRAIDTGSSTPRLPQEPQHPVRPPQIRLGQRFTSASPNIPASPGNEIRSTAPARGEELQFEMARRTAYPQTSIFLNNVRREQERKTWEEGQLRHGRHDRIPANLLSDVELAREIRSLGNIRRGGPNNGRDPQPPRRAP